MIRDHDDYDGANMSLRMRDQLDEDVRRFKQGEVPPRPVAPAARPAVPAAPQVAASVAAAPRRPLRSAAGWFNWHVNRGRMSPECSDRDMRRVSWRRAL